MQIDSKAGDILLNKIGGCGFGALIKLGVENAYFDLSFHSSLLRFSWGGGERVVGGRTGRKPRLWGDQFWEKTTRRSQGSGN